jgi:ABC-type uncharacterized transport system substrate-binding protein
MQRRYLQFFFLVFFISGLVITMGSAAENRGNKVKKVLVVHSYHPEYEWVSSISRGIKRVFEPEKYIHVETFYMDTQNVQSEEKISEAGKKAREIISQWNPEIVITADDNAQKYVGKYYAGKIHPKIVFCGVSASLETYGYPESNITGVTETSTLRYAVDFLDKRITPVKSVSIIGDDSPASQYTLSYTKSEIENMGKKVVSCDTAETLDQWKTKISAYQQNNSDAILIIFFDSVKNEENGRVVNSKELMEWSSSISKMPIFGLNADIVDKGGLLGVITSGIEHGREAALVALGLLNGKNISDYPVKEAKGKIVLLNKKTAERLGIPINKELLENVDVIVGD